MGLGQVVGRAYSSLLTVFTPSLDTLCIAWAIREEDFCAAAAERVLQFGVDLWCGTHFEYCSPSIF